MMILTNAVCIYVEVINILWRLLHRTRYEIRIDDPSIDMAQELSHVVITGVTASQVATPETLEEIKTDEERTVDQSRCDRRKTVLGKSNTGGYSMTLPQVQLDSTD
mmetsp:Transcript_24812/g.28324  ORF Transcript_24812/g.28324 Transcript_24812/m.28324 type:complete len:106 (+) Transcript_24812:535-852(+)